MQILIDIGNSVVTVDTVSRQVVFPMEYTSVDTIQFDTVASTGVITYTNVRISPVTFTSGGICDTALALWTAATPTTNDIWVLIQAKRTAVNLGGVLVNGFWFYTDAESLSQYSIMYGAISVNSLPDTYTFNANWKTMNGIFQSMTVVTLKQIINLGMSNVAANFSNAWVHKAAMLASTTPTTYDYSSGWTAVYA